MIMRFLTLQLCVLFLAQISRNKNRYERHSALPYRPGKLTENWAVLLASGLLFLTVAKLDLITDSHMSFLPLYLLPCMILTLMLNLGWGIAAALVGAITVSLMQYYTGPYHEVAKVFGWNFGMRLVIFLFVTLLLDRIRKENTLLFFHNHHHNEHPIPPGRV
jgi:hypothetical protein